MDRTEAVNPIQRILLSPQAAHVRGLYSCCSANEYVLRAAMRRAKDYGIPALIESTANLVNQFGRYTGQTPADFFAFVQRVAREKNLPDEALLIGGDHLGPLIWANLPAETAMEYAIQLVRDCVLAGYVKINLDTSMLLEVDDTESRLTDETIAKRGTLLSNG